MVVVYSYCMLLDVNVLPGCLFNRACFVIILFFFLFNSRVQNWSVWWAFPSLMQSAHLVDDRCANAKTHVRLLAYMMNFKCAVCVHCAPEIWSFGAKRKFAACELYILQLYNYHIILSIMLQFYTFTCKCIIAHAHIICACTLHWGVALWVCNSTVDQKVIRLTR